MHSYAIAIAAMVASVIGAFLYLRIMVSVWLEDETAENTPIQVPFLTGLVVAMAAIFTIVIGVVPGWLLDATQQVAALTGR